MIINKGAISIFDIVFTDNNDAANDSTGLFIFQEVFMVIVQVLTRKKMKFDQRLGFQLQKRFEKKPAMAESISTSFNVGGFASTYLGFNRVFIAYFFIQNANLRKWSWIGATLLP